MATETILSPGVLLQEVDRSFITPSTDPSGMAIIGPTAKGPVEIPTEIKSYNDFKQVFGTTIRSGSQKYEYFTNLAVKNYFENGGSSALIVRVVSGSTDTDWTTADSTHISASAKGSTQPFTLKTLGEGTVFNNTETGIAGVDKITFDFTGEINTSSLELTTETDFIRVVKGGTTFNFVFSGSAYTNSATASLTSSTAEVVKVSLVGSNTDGTAGKITAFSASLLLSGALNTASLVSNDQNTTALVNTNLTSGEIAFANNETNDIVTTVGNGLPSTVKASNLVTGVSAGSVLPNGGLRNGSADNIRWEILNKNNAQGTFTLVIRRGDDTTAAPIVLEQFTELSLDPLSDNFITKRIGDQTQTVELDAETGDHIVTVDGEFPNRSNFIRIGAVNLPTINYIGNGNTVAVDSAGVSYSASLPINSSGSFENGTGTLLNTDQTKNLFGSQSSAGTDNIQGLYPAAYTKAISILKDKETYKFKTLIAPGLNQEQHSSTIDQLIENTTLRGDSFFITDLVPYGSNTTTVTGEAGELDTSFSATYWPWVQVRSTELNRNVWAPASTIIPGLYSRNDSIAAPWFAPAGDTRGKLGRLVVKTEQKLSKANRDTLYSGKVNPIATFTDTGVVVFGQKTLQQAKSALDRVNVRRLLLDVKDTIGEMADSIVFEQNTQQTRDRFVRQVTPYLESLVQRQGVYAFQVKMDGQLNTPDVIDENKLVGQVFLQPTKTAEFVVLDFVLTKTGASFID